jgi:gliding motility-associated-like protein
MLHIKNSLLLLFFFIFLQAKSQNLVPNPSFENTISLPCGYVNYPSDFNNAIYNWVMPTAGTSDIFSTLTPPYCALSAFSTNPYTRGIQVPRTGTNMAGFFCYGVDGIPNYREYLEVPLISPLIIGKTYYVEMYVSASDRMHYAINNIGMYFSTNLITLPGTYTTLSYTPQVKSNSVITDTINWVKISGTFTATTAAEYLMIGNFYDDANTTMQIKNNNTASIAIGAYYYVDDVSVKYICTPKDSSIILCKGNTVTLRSDESTITSWALASDPNVVISNDPALGVSPQSNTSYIATYDCGATSVFEVIVRTQPTYTLGKDTTICLGQTISFDATTNDASYVWQDGSTNPLYLINTSGNYSVTITNGCGTLADDINVKVLPPPAFSFGNDTTICVGHTISFDATTTDANYIWQDGSTNSIYTVKGPGHYTVSITNSCGTLRDDMNVTPCCIESIIPNLITPNGDGKNDTFNIGCLGNGDYELDVYNIWGALIYQNPAYLNTWSGDNISDGIYYYVIKDKTKSINGWVEVLR